MQNAKHVGVKFLPCNKQIDQIATQQTPGAALQFVHGRWALEDQSTHVVVVSKSTVPCLHETGPGASWGRGKQKGTIKKKNRKGWKMLEDGCFFGGVINQVLLV